MSAAFDVSLGTKMDPIEAEVRHEYVLCLDSAGHWHRLGQGGRLPLCTRGLPGDGRPVALRRDGAWFQALRRDSPGAVCVDCDKGIRRVIEKAQEEHEGRTTGRVKCSACGGWGMVDCDCDCPYCDREVECEDCGGTGKVKAKS